MSSISNSISSSNTADKKTVLFVLRKVDDFDDGGSFPEIHEAQYPRNMVNLHLISSSNRNLAIVTNNYTTNNNKKSKHKYLVASQANNNNNNNDNDINNSVHDLALVDGK